MNYNWRDNLHQVIGEMTSFALDDEGDRQSVEIQMIFFVHIVLGEARHLIAPDKMAEFEKLLKGGR